MHTHTYTNIHTNRQTHTEILIKSIIVNQKKADWRRTWLNRQNQKINKQKKKIRIFRQIDMIRVKTEYGNV